MDYFLGKHVKHSEHSYLDEFHHEAYFFFTNRCIHIPSNGNKIHLKANKRIFQNEKHFPFFRNNEKTEYTGGLSIALSILLPAVNWIQVLICWERKNKRTRTYRFFFLSHSLIYFPMNWKIWELYSLLQSTIIETFSGTFLSHIRLWMRWFTLCSKK